MIKNVLQLRYLNLIFYNLQLQQPIYLTIIFYSPKNLIINFIITSLLTYNTKISTLIIMSSIKNFKSKVSANRSRSNSQSRISHGRNSLNDSNSQNVDLQNLQLNFDKIIEFKLNIAVFKSHQQIQSVIKLYNRTGARLWISCESSNQTYFHISPKKQILQNNQSLQIIIKLLAKPAVQFEQYQNQNFSIKWGRMTSYQLENKQIPSLTNKKILGCRITNKESLNQFLASTGYQQKQENNANFLKVRKVMDGNYSKNELFDNGQRQDYSKSGFDNGQLKLQNQVHQSILTRNNIIIVAVVSFLIGFIAA